MTATMLATTIDLRRHPLPLEDEFAAVGRHGLLPDHRCELVRRQFPETVPRRLVPAAVGAILFIIMLTWKRGRQLVFQNLEKHAIPLNEFLSSLFIAPPMRVPGTAIFLRGETDGVPHALLHNLLHNKVLHERYFPYRLHA